MEKLTEDEEEYENEKEKESEEDDEEEEEDDDDDNNSSRSHSEKETNNFIERSKLLFSSGSIKDSNSKVNNSNERDLSKFHRLSSFGLKRREHKNLTILFQNKISLRSENINYPLDDLVPIPIIKSSKKELVYLYLTEDERDFLLNKLDTNNYYAIHEDKIKEPLKVFIPFYYEKLFKSKGCLEK